MAYTNRQMLHAEMAYPELHPVTERHFRKQPLHSRQKKQISRAEYFLYLAINAALVFGMVQCARAIIGDGLNLSRLVNSQVSVEQFHAQTVRENHLLSDKIRVYSSSSGIEELARNYLNMVGQHELPVRFQ